MEFATSNDTAVVSDLREQLKRLESRLMNIESHGKPDSTNEVPLFNELDDSNSGGQGIDVDPLTINFLPIVNKCNFTDFKNRFCEEDGHNAVDVLVSGDLFEQEYHAVRALREKLFAHATSTSRPMKRETKKLVKETDRSNAALRNEQSDDTWVRRIRLQAPSLLQLLAKVQGESWSNRPRTYDRPFCTLLHFHPQVKIALAELEEKRAPQNETAHVDSPTTTPANESERLEDDSLDDSKAALEILRAYVEFIDKDVIPVSQQYDNLNYESDAKVLFSDLCYLFQPGQYIYMQIDGEMSTGHDYRMGQRIWKVYFVNDAIRSYNLTPSDHRKYVTNEVADDESVYFNVNAYHIDYTGDEFCVVTRIFRIAPYAKWRRVSDLPVYPVRFNANHESYMSNALKIGDRVLDFVESKHAFYNGWTVMRNPNGDFATNSEGVTVKHPEYINNEVMVDFGEAFQATPSWRPVKTVLKTEFTNKVLLNDEFAIRTWSGRDRASLLRETTEIIPQRTGVHYLKRNKYVSEDPFLLTVAQNQQSGQPTTSQFLRPEERKLLNCRVFAYVLGERKFAQLDVSRLASSTSNFNALDALKIPDDTKKLIQDSVRNHFLQKLPERESGQQGLSMDVIPGKGTGLFILLHGVPGVGKTATAEAVAQANGKPLFKITCGDIGLTPEKVEISLRTIFRLASMWDCILLMDEADTFFSQRSKGDSAINKNALVSGILFLTTNRPGALDEAFKSRIHYKIYYPPLTKNQTMDIWKLNIHRLRHITERSEDKRSLEIVDRDVLHFAELQFDESNQRKAGQWNGCQIRNAFQVARSLAYYDAYNEDELDDRGVNELRRTPVLDVKYFRMMHSITESFDEYMLEVHSGLDDGKLAHQMEHRADHFKHPQRHQSTFSREESDDNHDYHHRTPFDTGPAQTFGSRREGTNRHGSRPSFSVPGPSQRYSPNPVVSPINTSYDIETSMDDNMAVSLSAISPSAKRHSYLPSDGPSSEFRSGVGPEADYMYQGSSNSSRFGASQSRMFERGGNSRPGKESQSRNSFDTDKTYRMDKNEFGKRERS